MTPRPEHIRQPRREKLRQPLEYLCAALLVLGLALGWVATAQRLASVESALGEARTQSDTRADQAKAIGEQVAASDKCQSPGATPPLCDVARRVVVADRPSEQDTERLISLAVAAATADLPERVDAAVAAALAANPPKANVTTEELVAVVTPIVQAAVDQLAPPDVTTTGVDVASLVAAAVEAWLTEHPPPAGPVGPAGPPGVSTDCPEGEEREEYIYPDERVGSRCVRQ